MSRVNKDGAVVNQPVTRRTLLGASAGSLLLAACSPGTEPGSRTSPVEAVTLPSYVKTVGASPDLPGDATGVADGFLRYPNDRPSSVTGKPGSGETVSAMVLTSSQVPTARDKNAYWQTMESTLGVQLDMTIAPSAEYQQKLAAMIASGNLPDIVQIQNFPKLPQLLEAKFADLTPYLAGDAVKDYPNLANIPTQIWRSGVYNGKLYGIPNPRMLVGNYVLARKDILAQRGLSSAPASGEEFLETCRALTDAKAKRFAAGDGGAAGTLAIVSLMLGVPNEWREEGGKLTSAYETDEYAKTVDTVAGMWREGLMHPESFGTTRAGTWFYAGTTSIWSTGYGQWNVGVRDYPEAQLGLLQLPKWDGGGVAPWKLGSGTFSNAFVSGKDPERITMALRLFNWLAAPFGTAENHLRAYGTEGVTHTMTAAGEPKLTKSGQADTRLPLSYLASAPGVIYTTGRPDDVKLQYQYQKTVVPIGAPSPVVGLQSETADEKGTLLGRTMNDAINDIITGRKPFSTFAGAVQAWLDNGGRTIKAEYEEALQRSGAR